MSPLLFVQEDCWCPCGVRTKPMVTAKHPFGVGHDPGGGVDGDSSSLGKSNSNHSVPHSIVLRLVHLVGLLWCKERHKEWQKGIHSVDSLGIDLVPSFGTRLDSNVASKRMHR